MTGENIYWKDFGVLSHVIVRGNRPQLF